MRLIVRSLTLCLSLLALSWVMWAAGAAAAEVATCAAPTVVHQHAGQKQQKPGYGPSADAEVTVTIEPACGTVAASAAQASDPPAQKPVQASCPSVPASAVCPAAPASAASGAGPGKVGPVVQRTAWRDAAFLLLCFGDFVLILFAALLIYFTLRNMAPETIYFRRHWGGFGGASTGWTMSPVLTLLLMGMVLAFVGGVLAICLAESVGTFSGSPASQAGARATGENAAAPPAPASAARH
ncbi:hypothetical protein [Paraburkholderia ferrariae]|uniref:hypothetical protein n=1 Tax=Paraburkholderia ferrariae TaxID=386056 RepID=UPI000487732E|nr:hypothetical protein [Paraburkholderia ferrariae]